MTTTAGQEPASAEPQSTGSDPVDPDPRGTPPEQAQSGSRATVPDVDDFRADEVDRYLRQLSAEEARPFLGTGVGAVTMPGGAVAVGANARAYTVVVRDGSSERIYLDPLGDLGWLLERFVGTESDAKLAEILQRRSVAVVLGDRGSGRRTSATVALARRYGPDRVVEIALERRRDLLRLRALARTADGFPQHEHGYLLVEESDARPVPVAALERLFAGAQAGLAVVRPGARDSSGAAGAAIRHVRPASDDVFGQHLRAELAGRCVDRCQPCLGFCVDRYVDTILADHDVRKTISDSYSVDEVVDIAVRASHLDPANGDRSAIVEDAQPRLRERAMNILLPDVTAGPPMLFDDWDGRYRRAFRLAYAVFHGRPLAQVFDGARMLAAAMDRSGGREPARRPAFEHPVRTLLGEHLEGDWTQAGAVDQGATRIARLNCPQLLMHLLDVAWHEFDHTRPALLDWLRDLADSGRDGVRRHTALTAGRLAHHDFDQVFDELVDDWATSAQPDIRQMAAWALGGATTADAVADQARATVRRWARDKSAYRRDSAVRTYASGVARIRVESALDDLGLVARDRLQRRSSIISEAVATQYRPGGAAAIIGGLSEWIRHGDPNARLHVAQSFMLLLRRYRRFVAETAAGAGDTVPLRDLVAVWHAALRRPDMHGAAWRRFASWVSDRDLGRVAARAIVVELARDRALRYWFDRYAEELRRPRHGADGAVEYATTSEEAVS